MASPFSLTTTWAQTWWKIRKKKKKNTPHMRLWLCSYLQSWNPVTLKQSCNARNFFSAPSANSCVVTIDLSNECHPKWVFSFLYQNLKGISSLWSNRFTQDRIGSFEKKKTKRKRKEHCWLADPSAVANDCFYEMLRNHPGWFSTDATREYL